MRRLAALALFALALALSAPMVALGANPHSTPAGYVPQSLVAAATASPGANYKVVVQVPNGVGFNGILTSIQARTGGDASSATKVKGSYSHVKQLAATLSGDMLLKLHNQFPFLSITPDAPVHSTYENAEMWTQTADVASLWSHDAVTCATDLLGVQLDPSCVPLAALVAPQAPAIAIVDSGIDSSKTADFGNRVVARVDFSGTAVNLDDEGHGTMVAGVAAGASSSYPGVAQNAPLVDLRTADATGRSYVSDVIAAADWILANKAQYNIRVANLSLQAADPSSFTNDPLDKAVEKLWLNGVVVVTAAGNQGTGSEVDMSYAPANDPFVITVGAADQHQTSDVSDDDIAPWSAFGHTVDGFWKPDVSAPGRYMIMPVPTPASTYIPSQVPDRVVSSGYMWMSGTSFSAPVVSGAAAQVLANHPDYTPDQVKGALMVSSHALAVGFAAGVGEIDAAAAVAVSNPPNPNENLNSFVVTDATTGQPTFDDASWSQTVSTDASWSQASWSQASWSQASWSQASWSQASWSQASWSQGATTEASWSQASWSQDTSGAASWSTAFMP